MKSTHTGTCQVCGSRQKLPNGLLSIHGYTVDHGFFNGQCHGEKQLPFELSKDLVEAAIKRAQESAHSLRQAAQQRRASTDPADVIHTVYDSRLLGGKQIVAGWLELRAKTWIFVYMFGNEESFQALHYGYITMEQAVKKLNDTEADRLEAQAKQAESYVAWQRGRLKDWKPRPNDLQPVEPKPAKKEVAPGLVFTLNGAQYRVERLVSRGFSGRINSAVTIRLSDQRKLQFTLRSIRAAL